MKLWALAVLSLLALAAAAGEAEVFASWKSSLESLRGVVGDEVLRELERAGSLRDAILVQERELSKVKTKLETVSVQQSNEEFNARLQQEFSSVMEKLTALGVVKRNVPLAQRAANPGEWMKMAEELRESWSLRIATVELGQRMKKAMTEGISTAEVQEVVRIAQVFQVSEKLKEFQDCLARFKEGKISKEELRVCAAKVEPLPPADDAKKDVPPPVAAPPIKMEGVSFKLTLFSWGVQLEPSRVDLQITGGSSGSASFKNVAKLHAGAGHIIFKVNPIMNGAVIGSVKVKLHGDNGQQYVINMPCAIASTHCIRIMVLIPGYDTPMEIAAGKYSVDLEVEWEAKEGTARGIIEIAVVDASYRK